MKTAFLSLLFFAIACSMCVADEPLSQDENAAQNQPMIDELLLFFPTKFPTGDWAPANLRYQDVYFNAEDGTKLHGWYCPCESPRATILIAHGNAGHVAGRAEWLRYLQSKARVSAFMFDYRGYGRSAGTPTVKGALMDGRAARVKLCELAGIEDSEVVLMGESLGGAIVVQLAADLSPRALILQSTFSSLRDVADVHYPKLSWLVPRSKLDSKSRIVAFKGPLLQSHGNADKVIPYSVGQDLYRVANEPKTFITIEGAGHNDVLTTDYLRKLNAFIDDVGTQAK